MDYIVAINGFHGTNMKAATTICKNREYKYTEREDHWLGQGVYFFRDDPEQAMSWALDQVSEGETAVVLFSLLEVESDSFLNLNTRTGVFKFHELVKEVYQQIKASGINIHTKTDTIENKHKVRCLVMDLLPDYIKVVQKDFKLEKQPKIVINTPLFAQIDIEVNSVQVCVRDTDVIKKDTIKVFKRMAKQSFSKFKYRKKYVKQRKIIIE